MDVILLFITTQILKFEVIKLNQETMDIEKEPFNLNNGVSRKSYEDETTQLKNVLQPQSSIKLQFESNDSGHHTNKPSFLIWSVIGNSLCWTACGVTLLCSIPALVFSLCTRSSLPHDKTRAKRCSSLAYVFNIITFIFLILIFSIFYIFNFQKYLIFEFKKSVLFQNSTIEANSTSVMP